MTKIKDVIAFLESFAPPAYQEDYDNSGLLTGNASAELSGVLVTLDLTEEVIEEAKSLGYNLIIAHHPIIFRGLKRLTGSNYVERTVIKAIKYDICLYAIHTNLDNVKNGVNFKIAEKLSLLNPKILAPKTGLLKKLISFVPVSHKENVLSSLYKVGAGNIGNYSNCSFQLEGTGSFMANENASPHIGKANQPEFVTEARIELIFPGHIQRQVIQALRASHPYEEPAFDIILLENENLETGSGVIGELQEAMDPEAFLKYLKERMNLSVIKFTRLLSGKIKKVAACGGAGNFLLKNAIQQKADVFITSDFKYHEYFDADGKIIIADIGHYESEVFTKELICELLNKNFTNIAIVLSKINTNPISYI
jgi:dinuclear metal center YbgI/SA1388 family protein